MRRLSRPSLDWLLVFVPVSIVAELLGQPTVVFITSAFAIVPLAGLIGRSTEQVAARVGPRLGGLLNATFGNITELIVCVLLIRADNFLIVKASLIGSILGNLLLVLGIAFVVGGFRHKEQRFSARAAGVHSASLLLAVAGLLMPALLVLTTPDVGFVQKEVVSGVVAIVLIVLYLAALVFTEITHAHLFETKEEPEKGAASAGGAALGHRAGWCRAARRSDPHPDHRQRRRALIRGLLRGQEPHRHHARDRGRLIDADRDVRGADPRLRQPRPRTPDGLRLQRV